MTLTIDDVVTHYVLSSHPRNLAIVDVKDKKSGELRFIKIRHRLSKFYAVSLVDPATFEVWAETQVKSASARVKPIILHHDNKKDTSVDLRDSSRIGFEWSFEWEGEKYRWVRESRMSNSLECRAIRKTGDICVAQYLPRMLKDEYFGIFSLLGYNMLRCNLTKSRELELIILMSLMTILDKSNDGSWKRDMISKGLQDDIVDMEKNNNSSSNSSFVSPVAYEDPIPKKAQQKKIKTEQLNDQKLQLMLEKDVRRSQKQIQSDQKHNKPSLSAGNSPSQTPKTSPLPTPSTSTTLGASVRPRLARQKSASALIVSDPSFVTPTTNQNGAGRLSRLFSSLAHMKHSNECAIITPADSANTSPVDDYNVYLDDVEVQQQSYAVSQQQQQKSSPPQRLHRQLSQLPEEQHTYPYYDHHLSLPNGHQLSRLTNEFGHLSVNQGYDSPPSLRSIRWNPEHIASNIETSSTAASTTNNNNKYTTQIPHRISQSQQQYLPHRSNSNGRRAHAPPQSTRRLSASEYSQYKYHHPSVQHYPAQGSSGNYNSNNNFNRYSTSEYYTHQYHQQQLYDYY